MSDVERSAGSRIPANVSSQRPIGSLTADDLETELLEIVHPDAIGAVREYVHEHIARFKLLFNSIPQAKSGATLLDIGGRANLLPPYFNRLGYRFVAVANKWESDLLDPEHIAQFISPENFRCDYFDAESQPFPYADSSFETVVCSEVIEHLTHDPAHMVAEINRVLKIGGKFVLTTPNITSSAALYRMLSGVHPQTWSVYTGKDGDRHNREYTPREIGKLLEACGFGDLKIDTFSLQPDPLRVKLISIWTSLPWLVKGRLDFCRNRGEYILAVSTKQGTVRERFPAWLYGQS
jgi:2-polyprenyl-3-methyl-5-hydroxy-6-metoxy-1,4-benzoquinol methylase